MAFNLGMTWAQLLANIAQNSSDITDLWGEVDKLKIVTENDDYSTVTAYVQATPIPVVAFTDGNGGLFPYAGTYNDSHYFGRVKQVSDDEADVVYEIAYIEQDSTWRVGDATPLATLDSPNFTGNPTAPTRSANDNSTKLATTAYADRAAEAARYSAFVTETVSGDIVSFSDGADSIPVKSFVGSIIPQQNGSGDPAPDNIRPISGWTGANVTRTGKNLFGGEPLGDAIYAHATGSIDKTAKTVTFTHGDGSKLDFNVKWQPNTQYTFLFTIASYSAQNTSMRVWYTDGTKASISFNNLSVNSVVRFVTAASKTVDGVYLEWFATGSVGIYYEKSGVFEGSVNTTDLEPYDGQTIVLTFGETVYGGTLDVTNGVLTVNYKMLEAQNITWTQYAVSVGFTDAEIVANKATTIFCSHYHSKNTVSGWTELSDGDICKALSTNVIRIKDTAHDTDLAAWNSYITAQKTANTPVQILISLNTPVTIQLTPTEVQTLLGANTVWTDVGAVTEMEYRADTKLYIAKLLGRSTRTLASASLNRTAILADEGGEGND